MMSKKKWFVLLCLFVVYLMLGAGIFYNIESQEETKSMEEEKHHRQEIEELLRKNMHDKPVLLKKLSDYCGKPLDLDMGKIEDKRKWDFYHSLFFVITVVSTIGYGNLAPTTMFGRIFMIFYGVIGIPMNGIVMVTLGAYFGRSFSKLYKRWKSSKMKNDTTRLGLISQIILYLVPGFTFFIFLPSVIMTVFENWAYDVAVYYSFVTLTTIGFGDYVAGVNNVHNFSEFYYTIYQIFLLVWVIGGLGYVVMILGFITQGMSSKKLRELEQKITQNIKKTPVKIRQELRGLLQEFLFMRVKPVYKGEFEYVPSSIERSQSCPDLSIYRTSPTMLRKRALSECPRTFILHRIQSDTDLDRIDKERTFQPVTGAFMQQKDLLLKVVDALGTLQGVTTQPVQQHAYEGLSDAEILASERFGSRWSLKSQNPPTPKRRRAVSEVKSPVMQKLEPQQDLTWYGQGALQNMASFRNRPRTFSEPSAETLKTSQSLFARIKNKIRPSAREDKDVERQDVGASRNRTGSTFGVSDYLRQTSRGRSSTMSVEQQEAVLEQTSIADFIRALSAITVPETAPSNPPKQRKLGTAGITPKTSPQRVRRLAIRPNLQSRRTSLMPDMPGVQAERRRFSLRPVDENLLAPPPYSAQAPMPPPSPSRRFSRNAAFFLSPVQRQVVKRDKDDS